MKKATKFLLGIFTFSILISTMALAQIFEPEGLNIPGSYDSFTNPPNVLALANANQKTNGEITLITSGTRRWQSRFDVASSGADLTGGTYTWLFTSGPSSNYFSNKWAGVTVSFDTEQTYTHNSGADNSVTLTNGNSYVINWKDNGYSNTQAVYMELSASPVSVSSTTIDSVTSDTIYVGITLSGSKSTEEEVFVRYSNDSFSTSKHVMATGSGTSYQAAVPFTDDIDFYILTTTVDLGADNSTYSDDYDLATIELDNNGGSNFSYKYGQIFTITGSEGWRILSTPTSDNTYDDLLGDLWTQGIGTGADVTTGTANVQLYNISTDNFAAATDLTATMTAGVGFITYIYSDDDFDGSAEGFPKTLSLSGTENSGSVSPTLNDGAEAWTLVGNPYASTIDWDDVTKTEVTGTVYVYDHSVSGYKTWNGSIGGLTDGLIAPFQGFWVQNDGLITSPALSIEEADKSTGGTFYKEVVPTTLSLVAEMDNGMKNEAYFSFNNLGKLGRDSNDGYELAPLDFANYMTLSTKIGAESFDINNLPKTLDEVVEVPLQVAAFEADTDQGAWVPLSGEVTLSWPSMTAIPDDWTIELKDYETGAIIDLKTESSYRFEMKASGAKGKARGSYSVLKPIEVSTESADDSERFAIVITPTTAVSNETEDSPTAFALEQNYPNPFNPSTTISYSVQEAGAVNISVFNLMGQKVATLVDETKAAGQYNVRWNAAGAASGMYHYRLEAGGQSITRKMTLIK